LVRPYQVTQEIWKASDPQSTWGDSSVQKQGRSSGLAVLWWACWLIGGIAGYGAFQLSLQIDRLGPSTAQAFFVLNIVAISVDIVAAMSLVALIQLIRRRQNERFNRLNMSVE
jgi:hypothetical protein